MNRRLLKTTLLSGVFCLPILFESAVAEVTPEQFNLLVTAAKKDGGKDFNTLVEILVAANPDDEDEIRSVAAQVKPAEQPETNEPAPAAPAADPAPADGTIFSDSAAEKYSQFFLPGWDKEIELNALYSTGNAQQRSFGAATKFERESGPFHQVITTYFDYNNSDSVTNKRRYGVAFKNDYSVNEISYITGAASFEGDDFGAFNKRFTLNGGYGLRVLDNDKYQWSVEAGPAMLLTKPTSVAGYETTLTAYASSIFAWAINERTNFDNETKVFVGNRIVIENKTDFSVQVSGALSAKLSFDVLYNRDAPLGRKKTDTITRVGLLYGF